MGATKGVREKFSCMTYFLPVILGIFAPPPRGHGVDAEFSLSSRIILYRESNVGSPIIQEHVLYSKYNSHILVFSVRVLIAMK